MATESCNCDGCLDAEMEKEQGNEYLAMEEIESAIDFYTQGISHCCGKNKQLMAMLLSNRATAYYMLNMFEKGISDAQKCVALSPKWVKAYNRLAACQFSCQLFKSASVHYSQALLLEPQNKFAVAGFAKSIRRLNEQMR